MASQPETPGRTEYEIIQPILGMRPFILIEIKGVDAEENPVLDIRFGGGFDADDVPLFIADLAASFGGGLGG